MTIQRATGNELLQATKVLLSRSERLFAQGLIDVEAEQIVQSVSGMRTRAELFARAQEPMSDEAAERALEIARERAAGRPLQYLLGTQAFFDHDYEVGPEVLVPRPETEYLVARTFEKLSRIPAAPTLGIEIGIGSGAISIELLSRFSNLRMVASELMPAARVRALSNARRILGAGAERLRVLSVADPLHAIEPFESEHLAVADFLISNPPYLTRQDFVESDVYHHEPHEALFAPEGDPLHFYRKIALGASRVIGPRGLVVVELAAQRAEEIRALFEGAGWKSEIELDLAGRPRILFGERTQHG